MKRAKRYLAMLLSLLMMLSMITSAAGCARRDEQNSVGNGGGGGGAETENVEEETKRVVYRLTDDVTNYVRINTKGYGEIIVELYPDKAPETVANFKSLVALGFYNKLTFHRIIDGAVIQGGDPNGDGTGGSGESITGEFSANGFKSNDLSHTRGVISMARRTDDYNSASSQFFFCHQDMTQYDGQYAAFGKVIEGIETLDKLAKVSKMIDEQTPIDPPQILSIRFVYPD